MMKKRKNMILYAIKRHIFICLLIVFMFSMTLPGTMAWQDSSQHKSNEYSSVNYQVDPEEPETPDKPFVPEKPEKPAGPEKSDSPKTGDSSDIRMLIVVMLASATALCILLLYKYFGRFEKRR